MSRDNRADPVGCERCMSLHDYTHGHALCPYLNWSFERFWVISKHDTSFNGLIGAYRLLTLQPHLPLDHRNCTDEEQLQLSQNK